MTSVLPNDEQQHPSPISPVLDECLATDCDHSSATVDGRDANDIEMLVEAADKLIGLGLPLLPAHGKKPIGTGWHHHDYSIEEIRELLRGCAEPMIGLQFGPDSCIDIEADNPQEERAFRKLFEGCEAPMTPTFQSPRGKHRLFLWDDRLAVFDKGDCRYRGDDDAKLGIRLGAGGKGSQSIIPPSKGRNWIPGLSIEECPFAPLPDLVIDRILKAADSFPTARSLLQRDQLKLDKANVRHSTATKWTQTDTDSSNTLSIAMCPPTLEEAINATIPSAPGFRHRQIFKLARYLKGMPEYRDCFARELQSVVRRWHARALPFIGTKAWGESWRDFQIAWEHVKIPIQEGLLQRIVRDALALPFPEAADRYTDPEVRSLVACCHHLQQFHGAKPFFLGCREAASLLGGSAGQRNKWSKCFQQLCSDGVLRRVTKGSRGRASEYLFLGA